MKKTAALKIADVQLDDQRSLDLNLLLNARNEPIALTLLERRHRGGRSLYLSIPLRCIGDLSAKLAVAARKARKPI